MRFSRIHRSKRKVLLPNLPTTPRAPAMSWYPPVHNAAGRERNYWECCFRAHSSFCGCGNFIRHLNLLADRYQFDPPAPPPGGPPPGPRPALRALPPVPGDPADPPNPGPQWPGAGGDAGAGAPAAGGDEGGAADQYGDADLDALFAAVAEDNEQ